MDKDDKKNNEQSAIYPPVVSVLGHVDHGKTTLLDKLRKTDIASSEKGGITQRIGASTIEVIHEGKKRSITFIDTPGHEAFSNMRSYGVSASDLALLVVAADDGVMPQTKESIELLKKSKIPFIVVFTKKDVASANLERAKQSVLSENILLEGLGGEVPFIAVSAVTGEGMPDLIDLILLVFDMSGIRKSKSKPFVGVVIESRLDKRRGPVSTIIVKSGVLRVGDELFQGSKIGKVRALIDPRGSNVREALPSFAVEVLGIEHVLQTGSIVETIPSSAYPQVFSPAVALTRGMEPFELQDFFGEQRISSLKIVLKAEGKGELEAIKNSVPSNIEIVYEGIGEITFSDVKVAQDFSATVIGFNVGIAKDAKSFCESEGVLYRNYSLIYDLLEEIKEAQEDFYEQAKEKVVGTGEVLASFESQGEKIMGVRVASGRIAKGDNVKVERGEKELGRGKITSVRRGKVEVKEVAKGLECGIIVAPFVDFSVGDMVLSYNKREA